MADVHLANAPRHICGWPRDLNILFQAVLVDRVDVVDPNTHPNAFVCFFPTVAKSRRVRSLSASALSALAQKDLTFAGAHCAKRWRVAPLKAFAPAELFKPGEALADIGNV